MEQESNDHEQETKYQVELDFEGKDENETDVANDGQEEAPTDGSEEPTLRRSTRNDYQSIIIME